MWPSDHLYAAAFQNPHVVFRDPELRAATAAKNSWGAPNVITGAFAAVCKMTAPSGKAWAVRCFKNKYDDQQERYAAIDAALRALRSPATVGFEYLPDGILVDGRRYPILKMEWVDGKSLTKYVQAHLGQKSLRILADKIESIAKQLSAAGIAHGDLQHGNVILQGDAPQLIDYDGMYVPALKGRGSHECGHMNFQHPKRTGTDFGPTTDHFSVWAIAVALHALSHDASLWSTHNREEECLLFRKADFENPDGSKLFADLAKAGNPQVRELATNFRGHLVAGRVEFPAFVSKLTPTPPKVTALPNTPGDWLPPVASKSPVSLTAPRPPVPWATPAEIETNLRGWLPKPLPSTPSQTGSELAYDFARVRYLLAEWKTAIVKWEVALNELGAGAGSARPLRFSNSKHVEVGMWMLAIGATSGVGLCLGLGLPIWAAGPCVVAICLLRLSLAYGCYRADAVQRVVRERRDATSSMTWHAEASRVFAVVAYKQFGEATVPMSGERQRLEARFKTADDARQNMRHEPVEARRRFTDARGRHQVAITNQQRLTALGVTEQSALIWALACSGDALAAVKPAKRKFEALAFKQRELQCLADQEALRIDQNVRDSRKKSEQLSATAKSCWRTLEAAELQSHTLPATRRTEYEVSLKRLELDRSHAKYDQDCNAQRLRMWAAEFNRKYNSDSKKHVALANELDDILDELRRNESDAAAQMENIYTISREAIAQIDITTKLVDTQFADWVACEGREITLAVTVASFEYDKATVSANDAMADFASTVAFHQVDKIFLWDLANQASVVANAAQHKLDVADKALQIAVAQLATAESQAARISRDADTASLEVTAAAAALLVAEHDMRAATEVVAEFDLATRELADFRLSGVVQLDATALKYHERSNAAELQHAELTSLAKQLVTFLSFRDYLRYGMTP